MEEGIAAEKPAGIAAHDPAPGKLDIDFLNEAKVFFDRIEVGLGYALLQSKALVPGFNILL
jgi:hypothetical protein